MASNMSRLLKEFCCVSTSVEYLLPHLHLVIGSLFKHRSCWRWTPSHKLVLSNERFSNPLFFSPEYSNIRRVACFISISTNFSSTFHAQLRYEPFTFRRLKVVGKNWKKWEKIFKNQITLFVWILLKILNVSFRVLWRRFYRLFFPHQRPNCVDTSVRAKHYCTIKTIAKALRWPLDVTQLC